MSQLISGLVHYLLSREWNTKIAQKSEETLHFVAKTKQLEKSTKEVLLFSVWIQILLEDIFKCMPLILRKDKIVQPW